MKTLTIRDFRSRPRQVQEALAKEGEAILTSNGKPVALMLPINASTLDETLDTLRRARALQSLAAIRRRAKERGLNQLTMDDIDAEIQAARKEQRILATRTGRA